MLDLISKSADFIKNKCNISPEIGIVLGSGLGALANRVENATVIPYEQIECFPESTVPFHAAKMYIGQLAGKNVVCMSGRFHYYEGISFEALATPMRLLKLLGVKTVILTNAAGAVNKEYNVGDIMIISDHINLVGASPMRGKNCDELGPRFFDVSYLYSKRLRELAHEKAKSSSLNVREGVYMYFVGPHFETPAEIRAARVLGADAVGMSTVTEALTCAHCSIEVLGLSMMTNMAAGVLDSPLSGEEVGDVAMKNSKAFCEYVEDIVKSI